jgi:simple sugar transport system permease protein
MKAFLKSKGFREFLRIALALFIGLGLGFIITLFVSEDPINAYKAFLLGPLSRLNRIGDWLEESLTLILLGLTICIVFNASQWYIGVEGQMILGAMAAGCVSLYVPLPPAPRILLAFLAAMAVGALWGLVPALLKAYYNANELVTSLMLNTIALKLFEYVLKNFIMDEKSRSVSSEYIGEQYRLGTFIPNLPFLQNIRELWIKQTSVTVMVYVVIAAVIVVYYLLYKTPFGYELRMVGLNGKFARYGGINVNRAVIMSIMVSGIFAGLAGVHITLAIHNRLISNMTSGLGFEGINIAILASNNPLGVPIAGLLYGYLRAGSDVMERSSDVSRELVFVIQAMVLLLVTAERLLPVARIRIAENQDSDNGKNGDNNAKQIKEEGESHVA